ncbi:MAG: alpha/beta hydrolase [Candidatus Scalindua sp.]
MLIISSRENFWDSNIVTSRQTDEIRDVNLSLGNLNGTPVSDVQFEAQIRNKKILLLIHGYNNEPLEVTRAYKTIEERVKTLINFYDFIIGYTWPGGDDCFDYSAAKARAGVVSNRAKSWITKMISNCSEVDIMSHSMGCRISLMVVDDLHGGQVPKNIAMRHYIMAAAVDNESIEQYERYYEGSTYCDNAYIFHSKNDSVLKNGYRFKEWDNALGYSGPENPDGIHSKARVINCKRKIHAHGAYKRTDDIYNYIKNELTGTKAPQFSTL